MHYALSNESKMKVYIALKPPSFTQPAARSLCKSSATCY